MMCLIRINASLEYISDYLYTQKNPDTMSGLGAHCLDGKLSTGYVMLYYSNVITYIFLAKYYLIRHIIIYAVFLLHFSFSYAILTLLMIGVAMSSEGVLCLTTIN